jgi:ribonuclease J
MNLQLTALGGLGETGALNCMLYATAGSAVLIDCGVTFGDETLPGVNLVTPDFSWLEPFRGRLKAVVLTHGHEDHCGALPFLIQRFPVPVYATRFTCGIVRQKFEEFGLSRHKIHELAYDVPVTLGDLSFDPIFINHSIMDAAAILVRHGDLKVMHLTDFKIDHSAPENRAIDLARFRRIGEQGLDLLLSDSTNAFAPGWTVSETRVRANLLEMFTKIRGRIIACLFSSNMYRVQSFVECARITGRRLAFTGRSTKEYTKIALEQGRLDLGGVDLYDVEDLQRFPDGEVMVLVTGSQAESRSVLRRMSQGMFRPFKIREGDTLVMSSRMIPGNEGSVLRMLNDLALLGAHIVRDDGKVAIHTSGHAKQDELREVMRLLKPRFFMPIHGEYSHLRKHADIALEEGFAPENVVLLLNGQTLALDGQGVRVVEEREVGRVYISESENREITRQAVSQRRKMAANGLVAVSVMREVKSGRVRSQVALRSEGIFGAETEESAEADLRQELARYLKKNPTAERDALQKFLKVEVRHFYKNRFQIRPEVIVLVNEV